MVYIWTGSLFFKIYLNTPIHTHTCCVELYNKIGLNCFTTVTHSHNHTCNKTGEKIWPHSISVELLCQREMSWKPSWVWGSPADAFWGKGFLDRYLTASPDRKKTWKEQDCCAEIMATIMLSIWNTQLHSLKLNVNQV